MIRQFVKIPGRHSGLHSTFKRKLAISVAVLCVVLIGLVMHGVRRFCKYVSNKIDILLWLSSLM